MALFITSAARNTILSISAKILQISSASFKSTPNPRKKELKRELISQTRIRGIDLLRNPRLNKSTAFTLKERQLLGIHGLVPPAVRTMEEQITQVMTNFTKRSNDLDRYVYLIALQDRNEKLFYKVLCDNVELMMPIVYTPTVGLACQHYGFVFRRPRGLFISIKDRGHIYEILCNWPERNVKAIVVTDGERILGLGDLGAYGMGIPVGKLSLYTALGGVQPSKCLPVLLDVGTNNTNLHKDPLYIGSCKPRVTGPEYDAFIDEFMQAVSRRYGSTCLIQFEDFGNHNAFRFLEKYRDRYCVFNDDIQGTAAVAAAGVFASLRITGKKLVDNKFLFQGAGEVVSKVKCSSEHHKQALLFASVTLVKQQMHSPDGEANLGIAQLLSLAMQEEGVAKEEAKSKIWMVDSKGLLTNGRPSGGISGHKKEFAKDYKHIAHLEEIVDDLKPTAIIGAAAIPGAFTEKVIRSMAKYNERPVIFALSNPTKMAECTAEQAYTLTEGRCVFASGSPFKPVTVNGKTFIPGQGNNSYIFPGVGLGIITCGVRHVPETLFLRAARRVSQMVTDEHLKEGRVYPPLSQVQDVSLKIAVDLAEYVYKNGLASVYPEPEDKEAFIRSFIYDTDYECFEPATWDWTDN